jgi:hypothetical protein
MDRRTFITGMTGGLFAASVAAEAQQADRLRPTAHGGLAC